MGNISPVGVFVGRFSGRYLIPVRYDHKRTPPQKYSSRVKNRGRCGSIGSRFRIKKRSPLPYSVAVKYMINKTFVNSAFVSVVPSGVEVCHTIPPESATQYHPFFIKKHAFFNVFWAFFSFFYNVFGGIQDFFSLYVTNGTARAFICAKL